MSVNRVSLKKWRFYRCRFAVINRFPMSSMRRLIRVANTPSPDQLDTPFRMEGYTFNQHGSSTRTSLPIPCISMLAKVSKSDLITKKCAGDVHAQAQPPTTYRNFSWVSFHPHVIQPSVALDVKRYLSLFVLLSKLSLFSSRFWGSGSFGLGRHVNHERNRAENFPGRSSR